MAKKYKNPPSRAEKPADLEPNDIRRIREKIGLSQVEAGELLGGGPRAFTKYEGGSIKPAASISNILRMLDANPAALALLTGKKLPPIEIDGLKPFEVTGQHVAALSDRKLVNLARRLLAAEALSGDLPMDGIHVAAQITAPDGGEDAKIEWRDGPERTKFLPSRYTQLQLKATDLSPAEAGDEVINPNGDAKEMVRLALEAGGTYVLLCGRSYTNSKINTRVAAIHKALANAGLKFRDEQVQFRDADQIALWVNAHPPVAAWLLEQTQPGLVGVFRDWSHWAGRYDSTPWIADARLDALSDKLRSLISKPRGIARVIGLSGYGKSRLVQEALGPTAEEEKSGPRLSDLVLYAVESEAGTTAIKTIVQSLADAGIRAVIVVDRCQRETHQDLAAMAKRASSRLSLVTIDHETISPDRLLDDTILIGKADDSVIDRMLKHITPDLPSEDQRRLVKFSQGFPQIAMLLGQTWLKDSSIAAASDADLFDRIILGRNPSDKNLLREVGMLLSAFGLLGVAAPLTDLDTVANLTRGRSADDLRAGIDELARRGVVQQHGRLVSLQPKPLAMELAEQQWRGWNENRRDYILTGALPEHLRVRSARQLALINDRPISIEVSQHVCRLNGPLASIEGLEQEGATEVLSALAEINADAVVALLDRVLGKLSVPELKQITGDTRRHIVWALEKIAFLEETFEKGALLLLSLATAENERWNNNATGQFESLFPVLLSNTVAGAKPRLRLLDELIAEDDPLRMPIVVKALCEGADLNSHVRTVGSETHGSRPSLKPWQPAVVQDALEYIFACLDRLAELALRADTIGSEARTGMVHSFRPLASSGHIDRVGAWVAKVTAVHPYWPEALDALGDVVQYDTKGIKQADLRRVKRLMSELTPKDLAARARFLITEMPWDYPPDEKLDFELRAKRQVAEVEGLVKELLKAPDELERLLPQLSSGQQRMAYKAGEAIAAFSSAPHSWADRIEAAVLAVPENQRNFSLLAGFYVGLNPRDTAATEAFKQRVAMSTELGAVFTLLTSALGITKDDIRLAYEGLQRGTVLPDHVYNWTFGGVLGKLPADEIVPLIDQLLVMDGNAYSIALDLMGMAVHGSFDRLDKLRQQLVSAAQNMSKRPKRRGGSNMDAHHFEQMMTWLLKKGREDPDARAVAIELANHAVGDPDQADPLLKPVLPILLKNFASTVWPVIGRAIVEGQAKAWQLQHLLGDSYSFADKKTPAILDVPEDILFAWCHANPKIGPAFLAQFVPVLETQKPDPAGNKLHPMAKRLLDEFGDQDEVRERFVQNMNTFGWTGSLTTYYALFEAPLQSLADHPIGAVRRWAKTMLDSIHAQIKAAKIDDDEQQAEWNV